VEQIVISGLAMGSIYALIALSFVLIYNAVGVVNFATGEIVMLGAFLGTTAITQLQLNPVLAYIAACALMVFFGYSFNLITYYPLRGQSFLPIALSTLAASIIMRNVALIIWGANPLSMRGVLGSGVWHLGTVVIVPQNIVIFIVTLVLLVLQHLFFTHTRWGRMMRAVAQDQDVAKLMGIKVNLMIGLTFAYAGFLGGVAGLLVAPIFFVTTGMGFAVAMKAFTASIVGGFGSIPGAIVGGLFIGLVEILGAAYVSSVYKDAFAFIILILVLLVRPQGFFGEKIAEKA
jgi:branched-chain amino acid transport system permease protein